MLSNEQGRFADSHRVARLATADATGAPHVIPICYARAGDCFYFVIDDKPKRTRSGLKRLRNIRDNPRVALLIDDYSDDWSRLAYLLVQGTAAVIDDEVEFARALQSLRERYTQYRAMDIRFASHPLVRVIAATTHFWKMT